MLVSCLQVHDRKQEDTGKTPIYTADTVYLYRSAEIHAEEVLFAGPCRCAWPWASTYVRRNSCTIASVQLHCIDDVHRDVVIYLDIPVHTLAHPAN